MHLGAWRLFRGVNAHAGWNNRCWMQVDACEHSHCLPVRRAVGLPETQSARSLRGWIPPKRTSLHVDETQQKIPSPLEKRPAAGRRIGNRFCMSHHLHLEAPLARTGTTGSKTSRFAASSRPRPSPGTLPVSDHRSQSHHGLKIHGAPVKPHETRSLPRAAGDDSKWTGRYSPVILNCVRNRSWSGNRDLGGI